MAKARRIIPDNVRDRFSYDPETGVVMCHKTGRPIYACPVPGGRLLVNLDATTVYLHRLIWKLMTGEQPPPVIDHIDGDGANNRWANLRAATYAQNRGNIRRSKNNRTGFKGVWKIPSGYRGLKRYGASIKIAGKNITIGRFHTAEEAHAAYCAAAKKYFGEFWNPG